MVSQVGMGNRTALEARGFDMHRIGWESTKVPLYAHKGTNLAARGEILMHVSVENPKHLVDSEAVLLAKKASHGFFPWLPGEECMKRNFMDYKVGGSPQSTNPKTTVLGTYKGCKWCREETESQGVVEMTPYSVKELESPDIEKSGNSPGATVKCDQCPYVAAEVSFNGKPRSLKQRQRALAMHSKTHETV